MPALLTILLLLAATVFAVLLLLWPVQWAAKAMGAKRTSLGWCFLALVAASLLQVLGSTVPVAGNLVAFLLGALGFAAMLRTGFLGGIGIAILHFVFSIAIFVAVLFVAGLFGLAVTVP